MTVVSVDERAAARLAEAIRGRRAGNVEVIDVRTDIRWSPDRGEYLLIELVLSPPAPGTDTWPLVSTRQLREETRTEAAGLNLPGEAIEVSLIDSGYTGNVDITPPSRPRRRINTGEPDDS